MEGMKQESKKKKKKGQAFKQNKHKGPLSYLGNHRKQ